MSVDMTDLRLSKRLAEEAGIPWFPTLEDMAAAALTDEHVLVGRSWAGLIYLTSAGEPKFIFMDEADDRTRQRIERAAARLAEQTARDKSLASATTTKAVWVRPDWWDRVVVACSLSSTTPASVARDAVTTLVETGYVPPLAQQVHADRKRYTTGATRAVSYRVAVRDVAPAMALARRAGVTLTDVVRAEWTAWADDAIF